MLMGTFFDLKFADQIITRKYKELLFVFVLCLIVPIR